MRDEKNVQFAFDIFRGRPIDFVEVANGDGRKGYIPNRIVIRFDRYDCWRRLKSLPDQFNHDEGECRANDERTSPCDSAQCDGHDPLTEQNNENYI